MKTIAEIKSRTLKSAASEYFDVAKSKTGRACVGTAESLIDWTMRHAYLVQMWGADADGAKAKFIAAHDLEIKQLLRGGMRRSKFDNASGKIRARGEELRKLIAAAPTDEQKRAARIFRGLISRKGYSVSVHGYNNRRRIQLDERYV